MKTFSLLCFLLLAVGSVYAQQWTVVYSYDKNQRINTPIFEGEEALITHLVNDASFPAYDWSLDKNPTLRLGDGILKKRLEIPRTEEEQSWPVRYMQPSWLSLGTVFSVSKKGIEPMPYFYLLIPGTFSPDGVARHLATVLYADARLALAGKPVAPWIYPENHAIAENWEDALQKRYLQPNTITLYKDGNSVLTITKGYDGIDKVQTEEIPKEIAQHIRLEAETPPAQKEVFYRLHTEVEYNFSYSFNQPITKGALIEAVFAGVRAKQLVAYSNVRYDVPYPAVADRMSAVAFHELTRTELALHDTTEGPVYEDYPADIFNWRVGYSVVTGKTEQMRYCQLVLPPRFSRTGVGQVVASFDAPELLAYLRTSGREKMANFLENQPLYGWTSFVARDMHGIVYEKERNSAIAPPAFNPIGDNHVTLPKYLVQPVQTIYESLR